MKKLFAFLLIFVPLPTLSAGDSADLLVSGGRIVTMDASRRILEDGAIAVRGESIVDIGPSAEIRKRYKAKRLVPAKGKIVPSRPGQHHNHAPMVLFRGIADDLSLAEWLENISCRPKQKNVTAEFVEWGTRLACLEMIRSGTTTYADMYYFEDQVAEATARAGMRAVLGETILQFAAPDNKTPQEGLNYTEEFIKRWRSHPLIVPRVAPHAPYTNSAETLIACKLLADKYGVPMMIHVSETQDETKQIRERYGKTPAQWLESLGVLGPRVLFHHGVWLSEEDLAIVRQHGVSVSHNPESNMKLASGIAPVRRMLALGIEVGLGTDGAASNNNLDMFETMDFAAKLHKLANMDPTVLPAPQVLEMATLGGARALGMGGDIGSLEKGKRRISYSWKPVRRICNPCYNVYSRLVYDVKGPDVKTSVINGKIVMLDGKVLTLDENAILRKAREYQKRIVVSD